MINYIPSDIDNQIRLDEPDLVPCCEVCGSTEDLRQSPSADGWPMTLCLLCEEAQQNKRRQAWGVGDEQ